MKIPFFRPAIGEDEIAEVIESLRSGWLTTGPKTAQFEADFAAFIGGGVQAVAVNSATAALHLALEALNIGPGDEVICPTLTFTATAEVIQYLGADPVFVDCDPVTANILPASISAAITPKTKAILPVHFAGLPCDMPAILALAKQHGLFVVDDAAHALPTLSAGRLIGACGTTATAFSFYANKTMTTGEGGMLVTTDPEIAARARTMRLHGISKDVFDRFSSVKASWRYDVVAPGYKYNMTDIAASLGVHQLKRVSGFATDRTEQAERYLEAFATLPLTLPARAGATDTHAWHLFVIRLNDDAALSRDDFIAAMQAAGIGTSVHYMPLHMMTYWSERYHYQPDDFPNAQAFFERCVSIPLFQGMTFEEQGYVIDTIKNLLH
ncbi:MAG: DegT/DnrJ/EryC1/StrS family aminotransferase [Rhodobacteraceae bacterium]|nr:DegT/DnrJ/EryC1/StrS family aminotransferase [Paracoccaceae bacterium]